MMSRNLAIKFFSNFLVKKWEVKEFNCKNSWRTKEFKRDVNEFNCKNFFSSKSEKM